MNSHDLGPEIERALARCLEGRTTTIVGRGRLELPADPPVGIVRIDCARWDRPLGPVLEACKRLEALVEETREPLYAADQPTLRRRILEESDEVAAPGRLVELANRLHRQIAHPIVLAFESLERADDASLKLLERIVDARALFLPLLLLSEPTSPTGALGSLLATLLEREGDPAILRVPASPPEPVAQRHPAPAIGELPLEAMRVLRAGATVGTTFEADVVAALLGLDPLTTLELLQLARDGGAAVEDLGGGVFRMPDSLAEPLRAGITPSLRAAWHEQLAYLLSETRGEEPEALEGVERAPAASVTPLPSVTPLSTVTPREPRPQSYRELMKTWRAERDFASRSAEHAEAAGQAALAAQRYLDAASQAADAGGHERAVELLTRALRVLEEAEPAPSHRSLRLRALMGLGRIKWMASGSEAESYSLSGALAALQDAAQLLSSDDPVELHAELAQLLAHTYYDIGGPQELESALEHLVEGRRALLDAGRPLEAARLLNDEAAVRVRRGELQPAGELLNRSREMFARFADGNPVAQRELAETEQLMARLVLHAPEHEQRDADALRFALERAREADKSYERLGDQRERARVWETLARLERRMGHGERAMQHLQSAVRTQLQLGDAVGMARSTAALAELMVDAGLTADALNLLGDSIALNTQKGSLRGLAYNRRGLEEIAATLSAKEHGALATTIDRLRSRIDAASSRAPVARAEARP